MCRYYIESAINVKLDILSAIINPKIWNEVVTVVECNKQHKHSTSMEHPPQRTAKRLVFYYALFNNIG